MPAIAEEEHKALLRARYRPECDRNALTQEEFCTLQKYGAWLEALAYGSISPITEAQSAFLAVHQGAKAAETGFEKLWHKYQAQRIFEMARRIESALSHGTDYSYEQACALYRRAGELGNRAALAWLLEEGCIKDVAELRCGLRPLAFPDVRPFEANRVLGGRGQWVARPEGVDEDWGASKDDLDSAYWEGYLGGPDDSSLKE